VRIHGALTETHLARDLFAAHAAPDHRHDLALTICEPLVHHDAAPKDRARAGPAHDDAEADEDR